MPVHVVVTRPAVLIVDVLVPGDDENAARKIVNEAIGRGALYESDKFEVKEQRHICDPARPSFSIESAGVVTTA